MLVGGIVAATQSLFFIYNLTPLMSIMTVYLSNCATLKKWCRSLKDQSQLLERDGLCNYLEALALADNTMSDSIFHFSINASFTLLVTLYRVYSVGIGKRPHTVCAETILNKILKPFTESFTGLKCVAQGFKICFK